VAKGGKSKKGKGHTRYNVLCSEKKGVVSVSRKREFRKGEKCREASNRGKEADWIVTPGEADASLCRFKRQKKKVTI